MPNNLPEKTFWVTNFSKRNVTLSDLYISIQAETSVNLLDKRRYSFTEEQLLASQNNGSLFKKQHLIAVRRVPPQMIRKDLITIDPNAVLPSRTPSIYEIKHENYEELNLGDDEEIITVTPITPFVEMPKKPTEGK